MKTRVIRYTDSPHKGLASGTHPNTPSVEFYPNSRCVTKKEAWKKLKDDDGNDYWYNTDTQMVSRITTHKGGTWVHGKVLVVKEQYNVAHGFSLVL